MTYIPMPMVIPSSSGGSNAEYVYPFLPQFITAVGVIGAIVGICGIVICFLADVLDCDNPDLDLFDGKWGRLSISAAFCGVLVIVVGCVLLAITGQPIESGGE